MPHLPSPSRCAAWRRLPIICAVTFVTALSLAAPRGVWVGGTDVLGNFNLTELDFSPRPHAPEGTLEIRAANTGPLPLRGVVHEGATLRFELPTPRGLARFNGTVAGDRLQGTLTDEFGVAKKLHAWQTAAVDAGALAACTGFFQLGDSVLEISLAPRGQLNVLQFSHREGIETISRGLRLLPQAATEFYTAAAVNGGLKLNESVRFTDPRDGRLQTLEWKSEDGKKRTAARIADRHRQRRVEFPGPAGRLVGMLVTPIGSGPFPLFVQVHGSGPVTSDNIVLRARAWAQIGVATLLWDKRGTGDSEGNFRAAHYPDFAADAATALTFARSLPEIDPSRVGFQAQSEGGWVAAAAMRAGAKPDFVIMTSTGPIHPREQELYRAATQTQRNGLSAAEATAATEFMRLKWDAAFDAENFARYLAAARTATAQKWFPGVQGPLLSDSAEWRQMQALKNYDPAADFRTVDVPTLVVVSSADPLLPGERVAELWKELWGANPPAGSAIEVLPNLDHGLVARVQGRATITDPAAQDAIAAWLKARSILR